MKAAKILAGVMAGILMGLMLGQILLVPSANNRKLEEYAAQLEDYDFGAEYQVIAQESQCGKLYGSGNGMQYMVMELVQCSTPLETGKRQDSPEITVEAVGTKRPEQLTTNQGSFEKIQDAWFELVGDKTPQELKQYYLICLFEPGELDSALNSDSRAH